MSEEKLEKLENKNTAEEVNSARSKTTTQIRTRMGRAKRALIKTEDDAKNKLDKMLIKRNMSSSDIGFALGRSFNGGGVGNVINDNQFMSNCSYNTVMKVCSFLNCEPSDLLEPTELDGTYADVSAMNLIVRKLEVMCEKLTDNSVIRFMYHRKELTFAWFIKEPVSNIDGVQEITTFRCGRFMTNDNFLEWGNLYECQYTSKYTTLDNIFINYYGAQVMNKFRVNDETDEDSLGVSKLTPVLENTARAQEDYEPVEESVEDVSQKVIPLNTSFKVKSIKDLGVSKITPVLKDISDISNMADTIEIVPSQSKEFITPVEEPKKKGRPGRKRKNPPKKIVETAPFNTPLVVREHDNESSPLTEHQLAIPSLRYIFNERDKYKELPTRKLTYIPLSEIETGTTIEILKYLYNEIKDFAELTSNQYMLDINPLLSPFKNRNMTAELTKGSDVRRKRGRRKHG